MIVIVQFSFLFLLLLMVTIYTGYCSFEYVLRFSGMVGFVFVIGKLISRGLMV